jgi:D-alanine-D-alanine ligase
MTRIGFAYNQKPDPVVAHHAAELARADEEPPSSGSALATLRAPSDALASAPGDDEFAEWDSPATIDAVANALARRGDVIRLEATDDFPQQLRDARPDIVFNIAEGLRGPNRESHVPAICEFYGVPYTGSDPFTLALCLEKSRTKEVLRARGVPTADWWLVRSAADLRTLSSSPPRFPVFAKPVHEGSSKGITEKNYVASADALEPTVLDLLERYEQPVIVEHFLPGAEFTCGVLGNGASARVLPIVGMNFRALPDGALPIYGYEAKWLWDRPDNPLDIFSCPADITPALRAEIEDVVLRAYDVLGCRDWSRIDVRLDADGRANIVEVNPLPGILPDAAENSCLPKAARAAGLDYDELILACLQAAADRQEIPLDGGRR